MNRCVRLESKDFEAFGLMLSKDIVYQKRNLLIGKNGAGKTRFLRARMESLKKRKPKETIPVFLDFSSFHINGKSKPSHETEQNSNIYDLIFNDVPVDYLDFLNIIDCGNESMIEDLLVQMKMRAPASRKQASDRLADINKLLNNLIGYTISCDNNEAVIQKVDSQGDVVRQKKYSEMVEDFSPGERIIFNLCFFVFYLNVVKQKKLILLMDEPELHLHPQVLLKIIAWLYDSPAVEELWLASHSLFLVPMFRFQELVLLDSNRIVPRNSETYRKIYDDLVGLENINVFEFLKSLDNWQYYNFLVECFCHPDAVSKVNPNDEQFKKFIAALKVGTRTVSTVLDYGAGKFRIWDCIQEAKALGVNVSSIKYEAFEPYLSDKAKKQMEANQMPFPLYTRVTKIPKNKYDAVVLMNVLHEVDILEWLETFKDISNLLKPDGVLILLEVRTLMLGEQPYGNTGYLILGDEEIPRLFSDGEVVTYGSGEGKSNCWVITKEGVMRVSKDSVRASVSHLQKKSFELLHELFEKKLEVAHSDDPESIKEISAREYAFWSQQYINAQLALERFDRRYYPLLRDESEVTSQTKKSEKIDFPGLRDSI